MDLLVARTRLGEPFWPISTRLGLTCRELKAKGYVEILNGYVNGTERIMLTPEARKELIEESEYKTPVEKDYAARIAAYVDDVLEQPVVATVIRREFAS